MTLDRLLCVMGAMLVAGNPEFLPSPDQVRVLDAVGLGQLPDTPARHLADLVQGVTPLDGVPITASGRWRAGLDAESPAGADEIRVREAIQAGKV